MYRQVMDRSTNATWLAWARAVAGVGLVVKTAWIVEYVSPAIGALWFVAAVAFASGALPRAGAVAIAGLAVHVFGFSDYYRHHLYFLVLLTAILALADTGHAVSVRGRRLTTAATVPAWPALLLMVHVSVMYAFTATAKMRPEFLSGTVLADALEEAIFLPDLHLGPAVLVPASFVVVAAESFLAVGLWFRRTWPWALATGALLHGSILLGVTDHPLGFIDLVIFSAATLVVYPVFLSVLDERRLLEALRIAPADDPGARPLEGEPA